MAEKRLELLWNCAISLKPEAHTHKLLKSYYMNMCRKYVKNSIQIPKEKFATTTMCSHCGCFWNESEFKLKLKPQHVALKGKAKKLIEKLNKTKESGQQSLLNRKQRIRAKWLQKRATQSMEIKCEQCQHKSLIKMEKPKSKQKKMGEDKEVTMEEDVVVIENEPTTKTKKKKNKNKNKLAGLKLPPLEVKPEQKNVNKQKNIQKPPQTIAFKCPMATSKTNTPPQLNKTKKKKKSTNATTPSSKTNKAAVVSKTQQQNSLLHLAALLKRQSSAAADGKSLAQKRLESLLK